MRLCSKVISGSFDRSIKVWDIQTGQCIRTLEGHGDVVYSLATRLLTEKEKRKEEFERIRLDFEPKLNEMFQEK